MKIIKQLNPAGRDGMKSLTTELESIVYTDIRENFPGGWNTDEMTRSLLSDIKKLFHGKNIHTPGNTIKTYWQLHQLKNDQNGILGDIAIIVQISYHDGQLVRGAAFFDVAAKDAGKNTFSSLNKNRLRKLLSIAPHAGIILYDYDPITGMAFPSTAETIIGNHPHNWNNWIPYTHAVAVPANLSMQLDIKTNSLYKISLPLSYQLCFRYLYGLDMDYSPAAVETAAGLKTGKGNPKFLILISVSHGGTEPLKSFDFDSNMYIDIE
jgi:hypothetical protein